ISKRIEKKIIVYVPGYFLKARRANLVIASIKKNPCRSCHTKYPVCAGVHDVNKRHRNKKLVI
ncbi:MAG: hypothetical protein ACKPEQ_27745, partial [Dolichospermum sp.]